MTTQCKVATILLHALWPWLFTATSVDLESINVAGLEEQTGGAAEPLPVFGNAFHTHTRSVHV